MNKQGFLPIFCLGIVLTVFVGCADEPKRPDLPLVSPLTEADACFLKSDYNQALNLYLAFVERNSGSPFTAEASLRAGQCMLMLSQYTAAVNQFRHTLEKAQEGQFKALTHKLLADSYRMSDDYKSAVEHYKLSLKEMEKGIISEQAAYYLGLSILRTADWDAGYDALRNVVREYPDSDFARSAQDKINYGHRYFSLQLGAFRTKENAEKRLAELKAKTISDCAIEEQVFKGDTFYCIRLGNYSAYSEALRRAESLKNANIDAIVMP